MTRLIKQSELYDYFKKRQRHDDYERYIEVFKNPSYKEIKDTRQSNSYESIRGVIYDDGTFFVWPGDILHDAINQFSNMKINVDQFRFAFDNSKGWYIECNYKYGLDEVVNLILKYKDILRSISSTSKFNIYSCNDGNGTFIVNIDFINHTYEKY